MRSRRYRLTFLIMEFVECIMWHATIPTEWWRPTLGIIVGMHQMVSEDECSDGEPIAEGKLICKDVEFPRHHLPSIAWIMHLTFVKRLWYNNRKGSVKQSLGVTTDTDDNAFPWCFDFLIMIVYASFAFKNWAPLSWFVHWYIVSKRKHYLKSDTSLQWHLHTNASAGWQMTSSQAVVNVLMELKAIAHM